MWQTSDIKIPVHLKQKCVVRRLSCSWLCQLYKRLIAEPLAGVQAEPLSYLKSSTQECMSSSQVLQPLAWACQTLFPLLKSCCGNCISGMHFLHTRQSSFLVGLLLRKLSCNAMVDTSLLTYTDHDWNCFASNSKIYMIGLNWWAHEASRLNDSESMGIND